MANPRDSRPSAMEMLFGSDSNPFEGLRRCPYVKADAGRVIWCGCRPGECQQQKAGRTYECDCCGRKVAREQIATVIAFGIETGACDRCRGVEEDDG